MSEAARRNQQIVCLIGEWRGVLVCARMAPAYRLTKGRANTRAELAKA